MKPPPGHIGFSLSAPLSLFPSIYPSTLHAAVFYTPSIIHQEQMNISEAAGLSSSVPQALFLISALSPCLICPPPPSIPPLHPHPSPSHDECSRACFPWDTLLLTGEPVCRLSGEHRRRLGRRVVVAVEASSVSSTLTMDGIYLLCFHGR